jgi:hypothetical protein
MTNYKVSNNVANAMTKLVAADALPGLQGMNNKEGKIDYVE